MTIKMIKQLIEELKTIRVPHDSYLKAVTRMVNAIVAAAAGEMIVFVGPSRVGKSRCILEACGVVFPQNNENLDTQTPNGATIQETCMPFVFVEAENASKNGEFSTKAFMIECLKAIKHPIFGVATPDDPWEVKINALRHRTPERMLREAFENALKLRKVQVLVIDEAQHIEYVTGGPESAAKVLNSWKCIANKCNVKIILSGSYGLLSLVSLAPHVIGRQRPIECPRYRVDVLEDVVSWEKILITLSKLMPSNGNAKILCQWNRFLIKESTGCLGHLLRCLRATLGEMLAQNETVITKVAIQRSCLPMPQLLAVTEEVEFGERFLLGWGLKDQESNLDPKPTGDVKSKKSKKPKPFQRNARRSSFRGRA